jgi:phage FluMu gp28-like protein
MVKAVLIKITDKQRRMLTRGPQSREWQLPQLAPVLQLLHKRRVVFIGIDDGLELNLDVCVGIRMANLDLANLRGEG